MSEPCHRCLDPDCGVASRCMVDSTELAALAMCLNRTVARALAAEKQLATLAESGTGYSQQTVDAIVMERDELRAAVARVSAWAVAYGNGADLYHPAVADTMRHASNKVTFLLNDKETK